MGAYKSCNCFQCRHTPSKVKGEHKRVAHRKLRRQSREALRKQVYDQVPSATSSGYKA